MEGHIHGGIYTRGGHIHERAHTWRDTHGRTYTRGGTYIHTKGHTHGRTYTLRDIHTGGDIHI